LKLLKDYQARDVRLTDERRQHIMQHPEMANLESALKKKLRHPQFVVGSLTDPAAELSYRFYLGTKVSDKWLCVVVKCAVNDAFVVTAYLTDKPKKGNQLWPRK
jgi:hypothetical protein